jgi:hypothetical protein
MGTHRPGSPDSSEAAGILLVKDFPRLFLFVSGKRDTHLLAYVTPRG